MCASTKSHWATVDDEIRIVGEVFSGDRWRISWVDKVEGEDVYYGIAEGQGGYILGSLESIVMLEAREWKKKRGLAAEPPDVTIDPRFPHKDFSKARYTESLLPRLRQWTKAQPDQARAFYTQMTYIQELLGRAIIELCWTAEYLPMARLHVVLLTVQLALEEIDGHGAQQ